MEGQRNLVILIVSLNKAYLTTDSFLLALSYSVVPLPRRQLADAPSTSPESRCGSSLGIFSNLHSSQLERNLHREGKWPAFVPTLLLKLILLRGNKLILIN